jgi:hypothetical protein
MNVWLIALAVVRAIPDIIKLIRAINEVVRDLPKDAAKEKKVELKQLILHHGANESEPLQAKLEKFCLDVCKD